MQLPRSMLLREALSLQAWLPGALQLDWRPKWEGLRDVSTGESLRSVEGKAVRVTVPPASGRVYALP